MTALSRHVLRVRIPVSIVALAVLVAGMYRVHTMSGRFVYGSLVLGGAIQSDLDIGTRYISRNVTYIMAFSVLILYAAENRLASPSIGGALGVLSIFWILHVRKNNAIGFGDVLFAPTLVLYIGWFRAKFLLVWILVAAVIAVLTAVCRRQRYVAFVPPLVSAAILVTLLADESEYAQ